MSDEPRLPPVDPRVVELLDALARGLPKLGISEPLDRPPTFTGSDAAAMREIARYVVDERLRERRVLSDPEIRDIAKEVAHTIVERSVHEVQEDIRQFLTESQIEQIVVDKLRDIGLRADDAHIDETRQAMESIQRSHRRRADFGTDFVREVLKALAGWAAVGLASAGLTYIVLKGGSH